MKSVGFLGTAKGMTDGQKDRLRMALGRSLPTNFHHGDSLGAEEEAHAVARSFGMHIVAHPSFLSELRAYCPADEVRPLRSARDRKLELMRAVDTLLVAPATAVEKPDSASWDAVRMARRLGVKLWLLLPDGTAKQG